MVTLKITYQQETGRRILCCFISECVPNLVVVLTGRFHAVFSVRISLELRLKLDVLISSPQLNVLRFMKWEHCSLITRIIVIITVAVVIADIIVAFIVIKAGFGKYVFLLAEWNLILRFASTNLQWQFISEYDLNILLTVTPGASVFAPPPTFWRLMGRYNVLIYYKQLSLILLFVLFVCGSYSAPGLLSRAARPPSARHHRDSPSKISWE